MAVGPLRRLAAAARVPVFVARGGGAGLRPVELAADSRLALVDSPRHASVLVAAGRFPGALGVALDRVHDQLPQPRAVVWWTADEAAERPAALWSASIVHRDGDVGAAVVAAHRQALEHGTGTPDVLADVPPNLFEGRGAHGQGGEGMMGGVPYGRPMAMTGDDRDGLALDRLPVTMGPFLTGLSGSMRVRTVLQGGVVQQAALELLDPGVGAKLDDLDPADEVAGLRADLRWLSEALRLGGLPALASRAATVACRPTDHARSTLVTAVYRSGLARSWDGVGVIDGVDAGARVRAWLDGRTQPHTPIAAERAASVLVGQEWSDALVTLATLPGGIEPARMS